MSSCCDSTDSAECAVPQPDSDRCRACGEKGTKVDPITLKALLNSEGLRKGVPPNPRFCATATCPVVYFDNSIPVIFEELHLIVPVHAKHPEADHVPVCYCFNHTPESIQHEIAQRQESSATQVITAEIKAGHCACEVKNPKGACCLGDVARVERRLTESMVLTR